MRQYQIDSVIDVGAHVGQYGRMLRQLGFGGRIHSFEAGHEQLPSARGTRCEIPDERRTTWRLATENGYADINVSRTTQFASLLPRNDFSRSYCQQHSEVTHMERIRMVRLDSVLPDPGERTLLKTDTQGYDLRVLAGVAGFTDRIVAIHTELSVTPIYDGMADYVDTLAMIRSHGFEPAALIPLDRTKDLQLIEMDCLNGVAVEASPACVVSGRRNIFDLRRPVSTRNGNCDMYTLGCATGAVFLAHRGRRAAAAARSAGFKRLRT